MNIKKPVLRHKIRRFKQRIATEVLLSYARLSSSMPQANPDFLGIGPPRSATTWLFDRLRLHPDIFIPSRKEVSFFDRRTDDDSQYYFDLSNLIHRKWYQYYFKNGVNKVKGEISPAYSILTEDRIKEISSYLHNIKLIYSIRNPIDRAWSGLRFRLWNGKGITADRLSLDELIKLIQTPEIITRSCHKEVIQRWERHFPVEDIHYIFYDDIKKEPRNVLVNVCNFLNVDSDRLPDESNDHRRVNALASCNVPSEIVNLLTNIFHDQFVYIEQKFNRDLKIWYD